jgi:prepilin-type N-terminal cleavage/methylation domain-containing protein
MKKTAFPFINISRKNSCSAFTLIELLVVIVIIGILATISVAQFNNYAKQARDAKRMQDIATLSQAIELYAADGRGSFETENVASDTSVGSFTSAQNKPYTHADDSLLTYDWGSNSDMRDLMPEYLSILPVDPTNNQFYYYDYESFGHGQNGCVREVCKYQLCARLEAVDSFFCKDSYGAGKRIINVRAGSSWRASGN